MRKIGLIIFLFLVCGCAVLDKVEPPAFNAPPVNLTSYIACGCGCCGTEQPIEECLFHSKGDDLNKYIRQDHASQRDPQCKSAGCFRGIKYLYCD